MQIFMNGDQLTMNKKDEIKEFLQNLNDGDLTQIKNMFAEVVIPGMQKDLDALSSMEEKRQFLSVMKSRFKSGPEETQVVFSWIEDKEKELENSVN